MMKRFFALLLAAASFAVSAQEAPDVLVRRVTDEVLNIVKADKDLQNGNSLRAIELVEKKVLPHFDFTRMTSLAVGKDWRRATPEQKQRLADEFRTLLVRTYSNALTSYKNQSLRFKPLKMNAGDTDVLVMSEVLQPGSKPIALDYNLHRVDAGWKVYDVVVEGVSLVTNYRASFAQEVRAGGIDGLIQALAAKNATRVAKSK